MAKKAVAKAAAKTAPVKKPAKPVQVSGVVQVQDDTKKQAAYVDGSKRG